MVLIKEKVCIREIESACGTCYMCNGVCYLKCTLISWEEWLVQIKGSTGWGHS